jgi:hypothetical protein
MTNFSVATSPRSTPAARGSAARRISKWCVAVSSLALTQAESAYPLAARHTGQSWHQRFKQNASTFGKRVERFAAAGIDATMATRAERMKEEEKAARRAEQKAKQEEERKRAAAAEGSKRPR